MPKIQTDFVISGEKAYKQAVSEINSGLGVLNSEMRRVTAQFQENAGSVDALRAKGDVLERQLLSEQEKVEKLREALEHAKQEYGEADKRTMEWQKSLNNAQAAVANTEHAIRENNKALEDAEKGMQDTGEESQKLSLNIKDLASQFGVHLPAGLDKALSGMKGFSAGSVAAIGAVTAVVAALIAAEQKLIEITKASAANADDILTMSQITGLSTGTIQEMRYAAELIDVSFETIKSSMTKLKQSQDKVRDGNGKLAETFRALGVEVTDADGNLRNTEDVFYDVIDALGEVENATERDTIAMDLFGKKAEDLNPLILQGSDKLREYAEEANNVNAILSDDSLKALGAVDDAYQRMQKTQESIKNQMAAEMAPAVEELYTSWTEFMLKAGEALVDSGIIDGLSEILKAVAGLLEPISEINTVLIPGTNEGINLLKPSLSWIGALLASMADAIDVIKSFSIRGIISGDLGNALGFGYSSGNANHYQTWQMMQEGTYEQYTSYYSDKAAAAAERNRQYSSYDGYSSSTGHIGGGPENAIWDASTGKWYDKETGWEIPGNATGNMHFVGGRTVVGENGPEVVDLPEGSRIWNAQDSRRGAGSVYIDKVIVDASNVKEFNDIVEIVENLRVVRRMG